jgi:glycosyltransferase involved in cell wall biosynthesis
MRVAHVVAHPPFREGTGTAAYYNATALRELGCDVTVYAPARRLSRDERDLAGYRYMRTVMAIENAFLTPHLLRLREADIVHLHLPFILGAETLLLGLNGRIPLVVTYHNDLLGGGIRRPSFAMYNRLVTPRVLRRAARIAVVSADHASSSLYGQTIFRERSSDVIAIGNGVDTTAFRPDADGARVRERFGLSSDDVTVLFVAHLDRAHVRKGLPDLLEALAVLPERYRLLVVGDGDLRARYAVQADGLGLSRRVAFAGRVPHAQLPSYYAAADIVAIPSRPPESFGLALAEGMASGKPVIGCNIPGVRALVRDGANGFLIEPGDRGALTDRVRRLGTDESLRLALGARGRERVTEGYSWRSVAERLLAAYEDVLRSG